MTVDFAHKIDKVGKDAVTCGPRKYWFSSNCLGIIDTDVDDSLPRAFISAVGLERQSLGCKLFTSLALYPSIVKEEKFKIEVCFA